MSTYGSDYLYQSQTKNEDHSIYENQSNTPGDVDYLQNNNQDTDDYQLNPDTYGLRDITGKNLSINLKNLDEITYSDSRELLSAVANFYKYHVGLSYYGFSHDYSSKFRRMFFDGSDADSINGSFVFSLDQRIVGNSLSLNYLTGVGVSYFKGNGYFTDDGSEANMRLTLWILPIDFGLGLSYSYNSYFRLLLGGGLSAVAAIQSRSDLSENNDEKVLYQFGYGPFASIKLNIGLCKIFPKFSLGMFRDYGVTNTYLNIEYRVQNYSNFLDDFSIEGNALGAGISFNFM